MASANYKINKFDGENVFSLWLIKMHAHWDGDLLKKGKAVAWFDHGWEEVCSKSKTHNQVQLVLVWSNSVWSGKGGGTMWPCDSNWSPHYD